MPDPTPPLVSSGRTHEGRPTYGPMQRQHAPHGWTWRYWADGRYWWPGEQFYGPAEADAAVEALPPEDWRPPEPAANPYVDEAPLGGQGVALNVSGMRRLSAKAWDEGYAAALAAAPVPQPELDAYQSLGDTLIAKRGGRPFIVPSAFIDPDDSFGLDPAAVSRRPALTGHSFVPHPDDRRCVVAKCDRPEDDDIHQHHEES